MFVVRRLTSFYSTRVKDGSIFSRPYRFSFFFLSVLSQFFLSFCDSFILPLQGGRTTTTSSLSIKRMKCRRRKKEHRTRTRFSFESYSRRSFCHRHQFHTEFRDEGEKTFPNSNILIADFHLCCFFFIWFKFQLNRKKTRRI